MFTNVLQYTILVWLIALSSAEVKRISQIKCDEYINSTTVTASAIPMTLNPAPVEFKSYKCPKFEDLIENHDAKRGEFRHHVLLGWETDDDSQGYSFDCGGTLISDRYVLTAAHCAGKPVGRNAHPTVVRLAEVDLNKDSVDQYDVQIDQILKHPQHRSGAVYHDIALVRLKEAIVFSELVQPACLWEDVNANVSSVIATSFGQMDFPNHQEFNRLQKEQLEIRDSSECTTHFRGNRKFFRGMTDQQLCVGSRHGNRDTCQGDSGGPIQVLLNPKGCIYHVVGISSMGPMCGANAPAVYTKVASYVDWIESVVWGS